VASATTSQWVPTFDPGIHKHFRLINIARYVNGVTGTNLPETNIWNYLNTLYDLNECPSDSDDGISSQIIDFELPFHQFGELIEMTCKADVGN
jgi:hypothetical protein